jgi:MFS family permease
MKFITKTVWILSLVSLFTDVASEMLYPIMPIYLKSIGFSILFIGILEGIAEATSGLSKGYFGKVSDTHQKRVPFVQIGYALSAISKPLMAIFVFPIGILTARTLDRLGKGIRTGARDAILSDESTPENKGRVFGFHRSLDTLGAVIGPICALCYLYYFPEDYKTLFLLAFLPGLLAFLASLLLKEKSIEKPKIFEKPYVKILSFLNYLKESPIRFRKVVFGLLLFTLFNSSDVFLLVKIKELGFDDSQVISFYIFYNLIYAIFSYPLGILADRIGFRRMIIFGLACFATVYFSMAFFAKWEFILFSFFLYGIYAASTDGISKAWISNLVEKKDLATAIGTYSGLSSICLLIASSLAGWLWFQFGSQLTFIITGVVAVFSIIYFFLQKK